MSKNPEDSLNKIGLSFLEAHYKHRPKADEKISMAANLTCNKILVNGVLNFKEKNGHDFFAIFRIIDSGTSKYQIFDVDRVRLLVHGFMITSFLTATISWFATLIIDISNIPLFLIILFCPILLIYYLGGLYLGYYTNLKYMDDLKKCHANEKWIALSDRSLYEFHQQEFELLERQCIEQGLGIFSISYQDDSKLLVPPLNLKKQKNSTKGLEGGKSRLKILIALGSFFTLALFTITIGYFFLNSSVGNTSFLSQPIQPITTDSIPNNKPDSISANPSENFPLSANEDALKEQVLFHDCGHLLTHFDEHAKLVDLFQEGKGPNFYIMELQYLLHQLGFSKELGKGHQHLDGIYGAGVVAAVRAFAQKNGLRGDGRKITPEIAKLMQRRIDGLPFLHQLQRDLNEGKLEEKYRTGSSAKVSISSLQYVLNELGHGNHLNWENRRNDGVFGNSLLKALESHFKEDLKLISTKVTSQNLYLLLKDIGTYYGSSWTYHVKAFNGNKNSLLYHFSASNFIGKPLIVNAEFVPDLQKINEYAKKNKVQIHVNDSFRPAHAFIRGAIVKPATHSNHKIGHGIDMDIKYQGGWANSKEMYKTNEENWPPPVRGFLEDIRKDPSLRWGGDFHESPDPVHIDDDLNHDNPQEWKVLYEETQRAYENHDIYSFK